MKGHQPHYYHICAHQRPLVASSQLPVLLCSYLVSSAASPPARPTCMHACIRLFPFSSRFKEMGENYLVWEGIPKTLGINNLVQRLFPLRIWECFQIAKQWGLQSLHTSSTLSDDVWPFFTFFSAAQHLYKQDHWEPRLCFWKSTADFPGSMSAKPCRDHPALATEAHWGCPSLIQPSQMVGLLLAPDPALPWHLLQWRMAWALRTGALPSVPCRWDPNVGSIGLSQTGFGWKIPLEQAPISAPTSVQKAGRRIRSWLTISPHGKNNFFSNN